MKSRNNSFQFTPFSAEKCEQLTSVRIGEVKLGQRIQTGEPFSETKYIILGISEDIGPQSNGGFPGSTTAFDCFLKKFLNVQSNQFLLGSSIGILGEIESQVHFNNLEQGRSIVAELDDFAVEILTPFVQRGMIPIVIGGGHNNAFPLIKTVSKSLGQPISVINFDPHADFRPLEGRHSGNPFSYAFDEGWLDFYAVFGLHQNYNSQFILDQLTENKMLFSFFDDYISGKADFNQDLKLFAETVDQKSFGLELDMDSIALMPSSAFSPSGMTLEQARSYVLALAKSTQAKYFHLPEAAPKNAEEETIVGKALAYLVTDFIKENSKNQLNF